MSWTKLFQRIFILGGVVCLGLSLGWLPACGLWFLIGGMTWQLRKE